MLEPFDCYSPGARRLYHFETHGDEQLLAAEVRRTLDAMAATAPARIAKGTLTREEAMRQAKLWLAIAEDLERGPDTRTDEPACACGCLRQAKVAANGVRWEDKVRELRREILARRAAYPGEVDKGRLTRDQAKQQLEALEAVHDAYYRFGFAIDLPIDQVRAHTTALLDSRAFTAPEGAAA